MNISGAMDPYNQKRLADIESEYGTRPRIPMGHGEPLFENHVLGIIENNNKFVYCPVGFIISWLAEDYDHRYCPWCHVNF